MAVLRFWDLFEVVVGEIGFPSHENLQIHGHLIAFGCIFSVDLAYYE